MEIHIHLHHHPDHSVLHRLTTMERSLIIVAAGVNSLLKKGLTMQVEISELKQLAQDIATAVTPLPEAINTFEARITTLLNNSPTLSTEDKAELQAATASLRTTLATVTAALADAADGVDENAVVTPVDPPVTP